jgi:NAD(P)H-hydrate epimerase
MAMVVSCNEMKAVEASAFESGISAESLMNGAGLQITRAIQQFFPIPGQCLVWFGKGHNGGDALVAARHLLEIGWEVKLQPLFAENEWSELTAKKHREYLAEKQDTLQSRVAGRSSPGIHPCIVLDGMLGIGAAGGLREPIRSGAREINRLRATVNAQVFAIDLPTGLNGDTGTADADCVVADFTLAIGCAKKGIVADQAANFTGRLAVLPLEKLAIKKAAVPEVEVATGASLASLLPRRKFDSNKGDYGRVGIVAGSIGTTGAALMSAEAALRAGAGLVTLFATEDIYPIIASACAPEIMVRPIASYNEIPDTRLDVIAIGPGLGKKHAHDVSGLIETSPLPMVVDADALNILAENTSLLSKCAGPRLLTPHPGEMERLFETKNLLRFEIARRFTDLFPVVLLLKGSRTVIAEHGAPLSCNTTGSPGMATGGMGDLLTGVCAALIGQGLLCRDAARLGAWVCGRAAEIAICQGLQSEESLAATDLLGSMGLAFKQLRAGCF